MEQSPFERLPPELRNRIYDLVFASDNPIVLVIRNLDGIRSACQKLGHRHGALGLLSTSKRIYSEYLPVLYGRRTFELLTLRRTTAQALRTFVENTTVQSNLLLLKRLEIAVGGFSANPHAVRELQEILETTNKQRVYLPNCEIFVVLTVGEELFEVPPRLKLNCTSQEALRSSVEQGLVQIPAIFEANRNDVPGKGHLPFLPPGFAPNEAVLEGTVLWVLRTLRDHTFFEYWAA